MHLSPPPPPLAKAVVRSEAMVLLLLILCLLLLPMWESVIVLCFVVLHVFLVSDCCVALPRGAMGLSTVCNCGIS